MAFEYVWTIVLLLALTTHQVAHAQSPKGGESRQPRVALRTNLLYDATLSPNLGVDVRVDSTWTVGLLAGINAWDIDKETNKKWRHMLFSFRARKYRDSLFHKGYFEGDLIYSHYNVGNTKIPFGLYKASAMPGSRSMNVLTVAPTLVMVTASSSCLS